MDDIDAFVAEFADNRLHAGTLHADASANRVHMLVARVDGNLCAEARFAGDTLDFDSAFVNFRNFLAEEFLEEVSTCAGKNNLCAVLAGFFDAGDNRLDGSTLGETFAADLFTRRQHGFGLLAERNDNVAAFETQHFAAHHRADTATVGVHDLLAFCIADVLGQKLLGSLDGLATESRHRDFDFQQVAGLGGFVEFLGFRNEHVAFVHSLDFFGGHVRIVVREVIHDFDAEHHVDFVRLGVDVHFNLLLDMEVLPGSLDQGLLQGADDDGIIHVLRIDHALQDFE